MNILTMKPSEQVKYAASLERQAEESALLAKEWERAFEEMAADYNALRKVTIAYVATLEKTQGEIGKEGKMAKAYADLLDTLYPSDALVTFAKEEGHDCDTDYRSDCAHCNGIEPEAAGTW